MDHLCQGGGAGEDILGEVRPVGDIPVKTRCKVRAPAGARRGEGLLEMIEVANRPGHCEVH